MESRGVEEAPKQEDVQGPVSKDIVDRYVEARVEISKLDAELESAMLPFRDDIKSLEASAYEATKELARKRTDTAQKLKALEAEILKGTEGHELALVPGNKGHMVQVKRSFSRKVDADGLWNALDREGKLDHYGYLFKKSVTVKDFEAAEKQPLFIQGAEAYVETKVRSESVEVI
jgi:hypothetical protein